MPESNHDSRNSILNALARQLATPATPTTGSPEFEAVVNEVLAMHRRKGADYGSKDDFFANVSASVEWGIPPWVGAMMRANDKIVRLQAAAKGSTLQNEGIEDSLLDIATYSIIAVCLFRRENYKQPKTNVVGDMIFEERPLQ